MSFDSDSDMPCMPRASVSRSTGTPCENEPRADVRLTFDEESMGLLLSGIDYDGREASTPDSRCAYVLVSGVREGSPAAKLPPCRPGLAVKAIQGRSVYGLTFNETADVLRSVGRPVVILLGPPPHRGQLAAIKSTLASHQPVGGLACELRTTRDKVGEARRSLGSGDTGQAGDQCAADDNQQQPPRLPSPLPPMPRDSIRLSASIRAAATAMDGEEEAAANEEEEDQEEDQEELQRHSRELEIAAAVEVRQRAFRTEETAVMQQVADEDLEEDERRRELLGQLRVVANVPLNVSERGEVVRIGEFPPARQHSDGSPGLCGLVECEQLLGAIRAALLGASIRGAGSNRRVGLWGRYGSGLTSLLHEIAAEETVQASFPDGIYMLRLGHDPELCSLQSTMLRLKGIDVRVASLCQGVELLVAEFSGRHALLIVDDVVSADHIQAFDIVELASSCSLLMATSQRSVLSAAAVPPEYQFRSRFLSESHAAAFLTTSAIGRQLDQQQISPHATELASRCGGVPLVVRTLASHIGATADSRNEVMKKLCRAAAAEEAEWEERCIAQWRREANLNIVRSSLGDHSTNSSTSSLLPAGASSLGASASDSDTFTKRNLRQSFVGLGACFRTLDESVQARLAELAVFPPSVPVPLVMVERLWCQQHGMDSWALNHLLEFLEVRNWLQLCRYTGETDAESIMSTSVTSAVHSTCMEAPKAGSVFAIVLHPMVADFVFTSWNVKSAATTTAAAPPTPSPTAEAHQRLLAAWGRSGAEASWGFDGGYWLRHMLHHFHGAGVSYRPFALCAVYNLHWIEATLALLGASALARALERACDSLEYHQCKHFGQPLLHLVTNHQLWAPAAVAETYIESKAKVGLGGEPEGTPVVDMEEQVGPERMLGLGACVMPRDCELDDLYRCIRSGIEILSARPATLRQRLLFHLKRNRANSSASCGIFTHPNGPMTEAVQRLLRCCIYESPRIDGTTGAAYSLLGIAADWNSTSADSNISSPSICTRVGAGSVVKHVLGTDIDARGERAISCSDDGTLYLWILGGTGEALNRSVIEGSAIGVKSYSCAEGVCISGDGTRVAVWASDSEVRVWDICVPELPTLLLQLPTDAHTNLVQGIALSHNGQTLVTASLDKIVRVWILSGPRPEAEPVSSTLARNGAALNDATVDNSDMTIDQPMLLEGHASGVLGLALSADATVLLSFSSSELRVWRQVSGSWSSRLLSNEMLLGSAEWATAGVISTDGMCPGGPTGAGGEISCWCGGSVDASGRLVAARFREEGGANGFVIWSTTNCRPLYVVRGLREELWDLRMARRPDIGLAISCSESGELTLWEFDPPPLHEEDLDFGRHSDSISTCRADGKRGDCLPVAQFFADGKITCCALGGGRGRSLRLVCGLIGGLTCVLVRPTSAWTVLPPFIGIPKMAPDAWCEGCSCCRATFTRIRRRHHCRRCGLVLCNNCSRHGPPTDRVEKQAALREMRRSKLRKIGSATHYGDTLDSSSDEDDTRGEGDEQGIPVSATPAAAASASASISASASASAAGLSAKTMLAWEDLNLRRLRRCPYCTEN